MNPKRRAKETAAEEAVVRSVLDDQTVGVLRAEAARRGMPLDYLIAELLRVACTRVDELLDD